jgi:hypothetical protein
MTDVTGKGELEAADLVPGMRAVVAGSSAWGVWLEGPQLQNMARPPVRECLELPAESCRRAGVHNGKGSANPSRRPCPHEVKSSPTAILRRMLWPRCSPLLS